MCLFKQTKPLKFEQLRQHTSQQQRFQIFQSVLDVKLVSMVMDGSVVAVLRLPLKITFLHEKSSEINERNNIPNRLIFAD